MENILDTFHTLHHPRVNQVPNHLASACNYYQAYIHTAWSWKVIDLCGEPG